MFGNDIFQNFQGKDFLEFKFHDGAIATGDGSSLFLPTYTTVTFHITGTSTSRTVTFKGSIDRTNYFSIIGVNLGTLATATSTTGTDEAWQVDVTGLKLVQFPITAIAGGTVTITALAIK